MRLIHSRRVRAVIRTAMVLRRGVLIVAVACTKDSPVAAPVYEPQTVITILQGDGARLSPASQADTVIVRVTDQFGSRRDGRPVKWTVTSGRGSVAPLDDVTFGDGVARAIWTLGPDVGANTLVVTSDTASATVTADAAAPFQVMSLAPGAEQVCALANGGRAYCWGANYSDQLGGGSTLIGGLSKTPVRVATNLTFSALASKAHHTCGLSLAGEAVCWGLGYESGPTAISGFRFVALTTGFRHTCALAAGGVAYCWGENASAQLGAGTSATSVPTRVADAPPFVSISAGVGFTCGLTGDGRVFCWGSNEVGELGATAADSCVAPQWDDNGDPIEPRIFSCSRRAIQSNVNARVTQIAAGPSGTCASTVEQTVVCWGNLAPAPYTVAGATDLTGIAKDDQLACGLDAAGRAWCWGFPGGPPWSSKPELLPGGITFKMLSAGWGVLCGTSAQESIAYCWGRNESGQLGDGTRSERYQPLPVQVLSPAIP